MSVEDSTLSGDIEAHGHTGSCPGYALLAPNGKATKPCRDEFQKRVGTIIERTLAGEARMDTCKDRLAETERVKERIRARVERGAGDVPMEPGNTDDEQVAVRHADASGGYIKENQHEERRMRDIQVRKRGPEAAGEERTNKWRKTVRFEQEAPNASASSDPYVVLWSILASGETHSRSGSVLVQKSGHVDDDEQILRWMHSSRWMDERVATSVKCWSGIEGKMPEDLKRK